MSEADLFRQHAKDAMRAASKLPSEKEAREFIDLASTWAQATLTSERVLGSSFMPSPRDFGEATSLSLGDTEPWRFTPTDAPNG